MKANTSKKQPTMMSAGFMVSKITKNTIMVIPPANNKNPKTISTICHFKIFLFFFSLVSINSPLKLSHILKYMSNTFHKPIALFCYNFKIP